MKFCESHWTRLRTEVDDRGLSGLVAGSGEKLIAKLNLELQQRELTRENFDALMFCLWLIAGNCMELIGKTGNSPLYLLMEGPEDPVDYPGFAGRTWPRCPLCYVNVAHEVSCDGRGCRLPKVGGYDWMLARAADDALAEARRLGLAPRPA